MKKILIVSVLILFLGSYSYGQKNTPMTKGKKIGMVGIGFGGYDSGTTPTFMMTYQQGIIDNWGAGNLSVGGTIAFKSGHFRNYSLSRASYSYFAISGRASYHPHFINSEKWDVYGGLGFGYYSVSTDFDFDNSYFDYGASAMAFTAHVGGRYNFNENWSAWAELGNELSILSIGVGYSF